MNNNTLVFKLSKPASPFFSNNFHAAANNELSVDKGQLNKRLLRRIYSEPNEPHLLAINIPLSVRPFYKSDLLCINHFKGLNGKLQDTRFRKVVGICFLDCGRLWSEKFIDKRTTRVGEECETPTKRFYNKTNKEVSEPPQKIKYPDLPFLIRCLSLLLWWVNIYRWVGAFLLW